MSAFNLVEVDNEGFKYLNTSGAETNLGTETTLLTLGTETTLQAIDTKTAALDALLTTIDADTSNLDVALSSRATEATLAAMLVDTGQIETLLTTIDLDTSNLDVALSTRATEATALDIETALNAIKDTDGVKKITDQLPVGSNLIGKVQIRNPANDTDLGDTTNPLVINPLGENDITGSIAALNAFVEVDTHGAAMIAAQVLGTWVGTLVGEGTIDGTTWFGISGFEVGGTGVVSSTTGNGNFRANVNGLRKMRIRASLWTSGTANIDLNSTVRTGQVPVDGNGNIGVRVVSTAPPAGVAATIIAADTPLVVGSDDTDFVIPNGQTFYLQQLVGGNEDPSKGASIEIIYYDGTTEHIVHRDYYNGATHSTVFPDIAEARDGTIMVGDGSTKLIRIRRAKFSGTNIAIDGEVYGYTQ